MNVEEIKKIVMDEWQKLDVEQKKVYNDLASYEDHTMAN